MAPTAVLNEAGAAELEIRWDGGRPWIAAESASSVLGWEVKPQGLCRGEECVLPGDGVLVGGELDLVAAAGLVGRPALAEPAGPIVVIGTERAERQRAITALELPDVRLPGLDGTLHGLHDWPGRKKLFTVFASW